MSEHDFLVELQTYGTIRESHDSDAAGRIGRGRSLPENLSVRLCGNDWHEGWEFWGHDGRLTCGACHPPSGEPRWLSRGGPLVLVPLDVTPSALKSVEVFTPTAPALNDERAPTRRTLRRGEAPAGQGSVFG